MTFDASTWRAADQNVKGKVYIHTGDVVYSGVVNQSSFSYPIVQLSYDGASGTLGDVVADMTIRFKDSSGNFKKFSRVRVVPTANVLYIPETAQGEIDFANNDTFEILDEKRFFAKLPRYLDSGYAYKDYNEVVGTKTNAIPPKANAGPYCIKEIAAGDTTITVDFEGDNSYALASGAAVTDYAWDFVDGTPSSSTAANPSGVTFPAGKRWVSLTVTDSNGTSHTAYALVVAVDNDTVTTIPAAVSRHSGTDKDGWVLDVALYGTSMSKDDIPDGSLVIYYEVNKYDGVEGSLAGYPDRENVKFVGYATSSPVSIEPLDSDLSFQCVNALGMIQQLLALPIAVERVQTPTNWFEMNGLNWWVFVDYLLRWHSNVLELCDFERPDHWSVHLASRLDAITGTLYDQVEDICQGVGSRFTATRQGILKARRYPVRMSQTERDAHTVAVTLGTPDYYGQITLEESHRDKVGWLNASGLLASAGLIQPLLSIAPGTSPSQGSQFAQIDRLLAVNQDQINQWAGAEYADKNKPITQVPLSIANMGLVVDPADMDFVRFNLPATTNVRGVTFGTTDNFVVSSVEIEHDHRNGIALERWNLNPIVPYVDGVTVLPTSDENGTGFASQPLLTYSDPPQFDLSIISDFIDDTVPDNLNGVALAWSNPLGITFERNAPFWTSILDPANEQVKSAVPDTFSPFWLNNSGALGVYALTGTALYYSADALIPEPTFTKKQSFDGTYELARGANGVAGGIGGFGQKSDVNGYYIGALAATVMMQDLTGTGGWVQGGVNIPTGPDGKIYGLKMVTTLDNGTAIIKRMSAAQSGGSAPEFWGDTSDTWGNGQSYIFASTTVYNAVQTGETQLTAPPASIAALPLSTAAWAGFQSGFNKVHTATIAIYPIYNGSQSGSAKFTYSDDYGDTISTQSFGGSNGTPVGDLDDFGLGIVLAAFGGTLEYTNADYTGVFNAASGANVSPYHHGCIRSPFLKLSNTAQRNNDPTAFEFIFAPSSKLDDDTTLWTATLDTTSGVVSSGTDITPSFNGTPYVVAAGYGEQIEMNPTNPNVMLGCFRPYDGGPTELLLTENGGSSWESKGEYDYNFVRWSSIGNSGAWLAGNSGFGYTPDRGDTIEDKAGNWSSIGTVENARGIFPVG